MRMKDVERDEAAEQQQPQGVGGDAATTTAAMDGNASAASLPAIADGPGAESRLGRLIGWVAQHPRMPLLLALALGIVGRILIVVRTNAMIDGDEALVG